MMRKKKRKMRKKRKKIRKKKREREREGLISAFLVLPISGAVESPRP